MSEADGTSSYTVSIDDNDSDPTQEIPAVNPQGHNEVAPQSPGANTDLTYRELELEAVVNRRIFGADDVQREARTIMINDQFGHREEAFIRRIRDYIEPFENYIDYVDRYHWIWGLKLSAMTIFAGLGLLVVLVLSYIYAPFDMSAMVLVAGIPSLMLAAAAVVYWQTQEWIYTFLFVSDARVGKVYEPAGIFGGGAAYDLFFERVDSMHSKKEPFFSRVILKHLPCKRYGMVAIDAMGQEAVNKRLNNMTYVANHKRYADIGRRRVKAALQRR